MYDHGPWELHELPLRHALIMAVKARTFYLPEPKSLFIHVPRTGGTWVKRCIAISRVPCLIYACVGPSHRGRKHVPLVLHQPHIQEQSEFVFAFVRHPLELYRSSWEFNQQAFGIGKNRNGKPFDSVAGIRKIPYVLSDESLCFKEDEFPDWIRYVLATHVAPVTRHYELYTGSQHNEHVQFIGRTETIERDMRTLFKLWGYPFPEEALQLPRNHAELDNRPIWPDRLKQEIQQMERNAIERFYGQDTLDKRFYSELDADYQDRCPIGSKPMIKKYHQQLYGGKKRWDGGTAEQMRTRRVPG